MAQNHKAEIKAALAEMAMQLGSDRPLTGLEIVHLRALIEYAGQEVDKIQELKRSRKPKGSAEPA